MYILTSDDQFSSETRIGHTARQCLGSPRRLFFQYKTQLECLANYVNILLLYLYDIPNAFTNLHWYLISQSFFLLISLFNHKTLIFDEIPIAFTNLHRKIFSNCTTWFILCLIEYPFYSCLGYFPMHVMIMW